MSAPHDAPDEWSVLVAHEPGRRITAIEPFADHLAVHEWRDAQPRVRVARHDGSTQVLDLGDEPHDVELGANPEWATGTLRVSYQSLTAPAAVYDVDLATGERMLRKQTPTPNVDLTRYTSTRTWAEAGDGRRVPVDIVHHVDTPLDGTAPGVVYGYGSYESSLAPWFSVARLSLLDRGVVWALAHPRGGGELGRAWYLDGKLLHKRNTFSDTLAVADHLVAERIVDGARLAVRGASAGGLLVGACVTMRPERFAAAVAEVPFVDVVTTMSDPTLPLTVTEWEEWGDPRREPYASYIAGYSPYDNTTALDGRRDGRRCTSRPGSTTPASGSRSRPSGWPSCAPSAPAPSARCSCAPRWAPATVARAVATTPGVTRPASSPSCSPPSSSRRFPQAFSSVPARFRVPESEMGAISDSGTRIRAFLHDFACGNHRSLASGLQRSGVRFRGCDGDLPRWRATSA